MHPVPEACTAIRRQWFEVMGQPLMRVPKAALNEASKRISVKDGMRLVGTHEGEFVGGTMPVGVWEMTREEWVGRGERAR